MPRGIKVNPFNWLVHQYLLEIHGQMHPALPVILAALIGSHKSCWPVLTLLLSPHQKVLVVQHALSLRTTSYTSLLTIRFS
jgi:hypothetical protein